MPDSRVFEGKTTNEAIEKGLRELKVSKNDVEIKVIKDEEKRSFFDILAPRVVKVEMTLKEKKQEVKQETVSKEKKKEEVKIDIKKMEEAKEKIIEFLDEFLLKTTGAKIEYECKIKENAIEVVIDDKKADFLIGYRGETLNALQTILAAIVVKDNNERIRVELDVLRI